MSIHGRERRRRKKKRFWLWRVRRRGVEMAFRFNGLLQKRFPSCISGGWKRYAPADAGYYYYFFFSWSNWTWETRFDCRDFFRDGQFENGAKVNSNFFRMRIRRGFILSMKGIISMVNTELTSTSLEDGSRYLVRTRSPAIHNSQSSPRLL